MTLEDILGLEAGHELGVSAWRPVGQDMIDGFAEVTGDRQWIHVDPARAALEGPFGTTIAHGALTLSLCMTFLTEVLDVSGVRFVVNGGFDRVRFPAPVPSGSRLRGVVSLRESRAIGEGARVVVRTRAEIEGSRKAACTADQVLALYP